MWGPILFLTFIGLSVAGKVYAYWEREMKWAGAEMYSAITRKPILNVGCGDQPRYIGDVNLDISQSMLPNFVRYDLRRPLPYKSKAFGAAVAFHVLEHVDNPKFVLGELNRVADRVYVGLPPFWDPYAYLAPEHKWVYLEGSAIPISGASNLATLGALLSGVGLTWLATKGSSRKPRRGRK